MKLADTLRSVREAGSYYSAQKKKRQPPGLSFKALALANLVEMGSI